MRSNCRYRAVAVVGLVAQLEAYSQTTIGSVSGLVDELAARPKLSLGYVPPGLLRVRDDGTIEVIRGRSDQCVRGDGSLAVCSTDASASILVLETPVGAINSLNTVFQLSQTLSSPSALLLFRNGVLQRQGADYTLNGQTVTFINGVIPTTGDILSAAFFPGTQQGSLMLMPASTTPVSQQVAPAQAVATLTSISSTAPSAEVVEGTMAGGAPDNASTATARGVEPQTWRYPPAARNWERFRTTLHGNVREVRQRSGAQRQKSPLVPILTIEDDGER